MTIEERNDIVVKNMNLVHHHAHKMYISPDAYYSYEDVVQEGMIGLIKAAENFNAELGFSFATYASSMIRGYMLRFIRDNQYGMRYSRKDIDNLIKIQRSGKQLSEITKDDLEELGITNYQLSVVIAMVSRISLDAQYDVSSDNSVSLLEMLPAKSEEFSDEFYESELENIKNKILKDKFPSAKIQDIIDEWYYSSLIGMKSDQIYLAKKYGFSQGHISRIIRNFKQELKNGLSSED